MKDYQPAIDDFTRAIAIRPDLHTAYVNRSLVFEAQESWQKAIADITKAIELLPLEPRLYSIRAGMYRKLGDMRHADEDDARSKHLQEQSGAKTSL